MEKQMKALRSELADKMIKQGVKIPIEEGATFQFEGKTYQIEKNYHLSMDNAQKSQNIFQFLLKSLIFLKKKFLPKSTHISSIETTNQIHIVPFEEKKSENSLEQEIQDMLKNGWLSGVCRYIEEGYDLNNHDCLLFLKHLSDAKYDTQIEYIQDIFLKKELPLKYQALFFFILHNHNIIPDFQDKMKNNQKNDEFVYYVQYFWMLNLENYHKCLKKGQYFYPDYHWRNTFLSYHNIVLNHITKSKLQFIFETLKQIKDKDLSSTDISKMLEFIQKNSYQIISKDIENDIQKFQKISTESNFPLKEVKNTFFTHQNQLSQQTKDILKNLQNLCENLNLEKLEKEELFQLQNISEKRIPEILQKYLSIDPEYRIELRNSKGQNAEELMNESLEELRDYLKIIHKNMNENKFNELAVTHQYVKSMNKSL